ncbi:hypothetical protein D9C73_025660 [Collichthys lucidus]|uniref:Uncharacterized protein n=1 Tax=Collichthys lucidus TaxID=240159 RepID=A0A4U5VU70_COLLU|nr:hypothetical protein D9C73_025660 [Collichthys lucidus]
MNYSSCFESILEKVKPLIPTIDFDSLSHQITTVMLLQFDDEEIVTVYQRPASLPLTVPEDFSFLMDDDEPEELLKPVKPEETRSRSVKLDEEVTTTQHPDADFKAGAYEGGVVDTRLDASVKPDVDNTKSDEGFPVLSFAHVDNKVILTINACVSGQQGQQVKQTLQHEQHQEILRQLEIHRPIKSVNQLQPAAEKTDVLFDFVGPDPRHNEDEAGAKVPFWVAGLQQLWTEDGLALHVLVVSRHCYAARVIDRVFGLSPGFYWQTVETQEHVCKGRETTLDLHTEVSVAMGSKAFFLHPIITHYTLQLILDSGLDVCGLRLLYPPQEFLSDGAADLLLVVSPVVPPYCYGQILAVCERRGLESDGAAEAAASNQWSYSPWTQQTAALMREFMAQNLLGCIHSRIKGVHTVDPSFCFHTVPYSSNLFRIFVRCMWSLPDPSSVILSRQKRSSNSNMEQVVVLTLCGKDMSHGLSLLHRVLTAEAEGDGQHARLKLLGLKYLPALSRFQAQELSPYEVGEQLYLDSLENLMSSPALVCALRQLEASASLRKLLPHNYPGNVSALMSPTPEAAFRQASLFFFEHEMTAGGECREEAAGSAGTSGLIPANDYLLAWVIHTKAAMVSALPCTLVINMCSDPLATEGLLPLMATRPNEVPGSLIRSALWQTTCLLIPLNAPPLNQVPSQLDMLEQLLRSGCHLVAGRMSVLDNEQKKHISEMLSSRGNEMMAHLSNSPCFVVAVQGEMIVTHFDSILRRCGEVKLIM